MIVAVVVIAVVVVVALVVAAVLVRRRGGGTDDLPPPAASRPEPTPMTGLESALDGVMGRDGRPLREAIDAEAGEVDDMRVPDDTGPLLRRALDRFAPEADESAPDAPPTEGGPSPR